MVKLASEEAQIENGEAEAEAGRDFVANKFQQLTEQELMMSSI